MDHGSARRVPPPAPALHLQDTTDRPVAPPPFRSPATSGLGTGRLCDGRDGAEVAAIALTGSVIADPDGQHSPGATTDTDDAHTDIGDAGAEDANTHPNPDAFREPEPVTLAPSSACLRPGVRRLRQPGGRGLRRFGGHVGGRLRRRHRRGRRRADRPALVGDPGQRLEHPPRHRDAPRAVARRRQQHDRRRPGSRASSPRTSDDGGGVRRG